MLGRRGPARPRPPSVAALRSRSPDRRDPDGAQITETLELDGHEAPAISAKHGTWRPRGSGGHRRAHPAPPAGDRQALLKALAFDCFYDPCRGRRPLSRRGQPLRKACATPWRSCGSTTRPSPSIRSSPWPLATFSSLAFLGMPCPDIVQECLKQGRRSLRLLTRAPKSALIQQSHGTCCSRGALPLVEVRDGTRRGAGTRSTAEEETHGRRDTSTEEYGPSSRG
jgi:hypothetical protein